MFIVVEGLDGSGKTFLSKELAKCLNAEYMTTPSPCIREIRDSIISDFGTCPEAIELFYLSTVFAASNQIKTKIQNGQSVILDRYFLTTESYAQMRGSSIDISCYQKDLLIPDYTIFLDTPCHIRQQRLNARGSGSSIQDYATLETTIDDKLRQLYLSKRNQPIAGSWIHYINYYLTPIKQVEELTKLIKNG